MKMYGFWGLMAVLCAFALVFVGCESRSTGVEDSQDSAGTQDPAGSSGGVKRELRMPEPPAAVEMQGQVEESAENMSETANAEEKMEEIKEEAAQMASAGEAAVEESVKLDELLMVANGWQPAFQEFYGKKISDFKVRDLEGEVFDLAAQKGKDVMVIFFATWCPPCKAEIPHLKALRGEVKESDLTMLAVSNESEGTVSPFVKKNELNYKVAATPSSKLPMPLRAVQYLPTVFFLDGEGKLKLAAVGMMPEEQMKLALRLE